ncbi:MAG: ATP-grasp domain-containing protein [Acidobacteriota bacterium]
MLGVLYEHPVWFEPLFAALERRQLPYARIRADELTWDPRARPPYALVLNRMSPSAYLRGHGHAIRTTEAYLAYLAAHDIPVVNGLAAWRLETSKAAQVDLLTGLGVRHPRTLVTNTAAGVVDAAEEVGFPLVVKPNVGGSGAGIQRFDTRGALAAAAEAGQLDRSLDGTLLVQQLIPARGGSITRVEVLGGELLYAIRITPPAGLFNLCPADICRPDSPQQAERQTDAGMCVTKPAMQIEATTVSLAVLRDALAIARHAELDVCGIEFITHDGDGQPYFYDINALSNFVTDAVRIVGFDPFERFARHLESKLAGVQEAVVSG